MFCKILQGIVMAFHDASGISITFIEIFKYILIYCTPHWQLSSWSLPPRKSLNIYHKIIIKFRGKSPFARSAEPLSRVSRTWETSSFRLPLSVFLDLRQTSFQWVFIHYSWLSKAITDVNITFSKQSLKITVKIFLEKMQQFYAKEMKEVLTLVILWDCELNVDWYANI